MLHAISSSAALGCKLARVVLRSFRNPRQFPRQQRIATGQLGKIMAPLSPALGENNPVSACQCGPLSAAAPASKPMAFSGRRSHGKMPKGLKTAAPTTRRQLHVDRSGATRGEVANCRPMNIHWFRGRDHSFRSVATDAARTAPIIAAGLPADQHTSSRSPDAPRNTRRELYGVQ
jgi:hypothetical protein